MEKHAFSYVLSKQTYHSISDGHLWFLIFSRPPSNQFTRVQRCTCCFILLFLSMFLNIIYYDLSNDTKTTGALTLSFTSFYINPQQVWRKDVSFVWLWYWYVIDHHWCDCWSVCLDSESVSCAIVSESSIPSTAHVTNTSSSLQNQTTYTHVCRNLLFHRLDILPLLVKKMFNKRRRSKHWHSHFRGGASSLHMDCVWC